MKKTSIILAATVSVSCVVFACITTDTPFYCVKQGWLDGTPTIVCTNPQCQEGILSGPDCLIDMIKEGALYSGKDGVKSTPVECYWRSVIYVCSASCVQSESYDPPTGSKTNTCNALTPDGPDCPHAL